VGVKKYDIWPRFRPQSPLKSVLVSKHSKISAI